MMGRIRDALRALGGRKTETIDEMRRAVKAVYYSAASDSPSMDFRLAHDVGINRSLLADLNKIRARCRYELRQNGLAKGMPRVYANSVVGTGPRLSISSGDTAWDKQAERAFSKWARHADMMSAGSLGLQLHGSVRQLFPAGEYLLARRQAKSGDVRLRYLAIRPDRLRTPSFGRDRSNEIIDQGVEVDRDGIPVAYWISQTDPDNGDYMASTEQFDRIPAAAIIHVFYNEDPIQHRGEPWMTQGLAVWHKLRRYDEAEIAAAIVAAKFAAVLINTNPDVVADAGKILPTSVLEIQDGMMMVPPPGYEPRQIDPKQPSANSADFRRDQIGSAGAANAMPVNIASQDSSRGSFASSRYDGVTLEQDGHVVRGMIEDLHLSRVWADWLAEATAAGVLPAPRDEPTVSWLWPREDRHTDPLKQASADKVRIETATATVGEIQMESGTDREDARDALLEEVDWFRKNGLKHPLDAKSAQGAGGFGAEGAPRWRTADAISQ
jgi:lambda family phage portal protein